MLKKGNLVYTHELYINIRYNYEDFKMGLVDQVKTAATSLVTPNATIEKVHNNEDADIGSTFDAVDGADTPQEAAINPWNVKLASMDSFNARVQSSGWYNRTSDIIFQASNDSYNFSNTQLRFSKPNGVQNFSNEMQGTIAKMVDARQYYNTQKTNQFNLEAKYPNLTFTSSQFGLLYTDPSTGKTGLASELG